MLEKPFGIWLVVALLGIVLSSSGLSALSGGRTGQAQLASDQESSALAQVQDVDWPQLQHDAARTGRTSASVNPARIRARWIWFGSDWVLRNRDSEPGNPSWNDDLASYEGHDLRIPLSVPFHFAESMQPLIVGGKVFVGDVKMNKVWALSLDDGATLWEADNPGGTAWSGVATHSIVVFPSLLGYVTAWDAQTGAELWQIDTGKTISHSPALVEDTLYVASQNGRVYSINIHDGRVNWQTDTGAPIQSGLAVSEGRVFVGNEAMYAVSLDAQTGQEIARTRLIGQSFRRIWPVVAGGRVIWRTVPVIAVGSEYFLDGVIDGTDDRFEDEQMKLRDWLDGDGKLYQHYFALDVETMSLDYAIPNGPVGGIGHHADPPVVDSQGRPLTWWPTYFGTISTCSFGCPPGYDVDIASFDLVTGLGVQLPNPRGVTIFDVETDNTFAMTMGGDVLYLRQTFRGTRAIDFSRMQSYWVSAIYRWRDCGGWQAPLNYAQGVPGCPEGSWEGVIQVPNESEEFLGHTAPAVVPGLICFTETFAVTCMEDY